MASVRFGWRRDVNVTILNTAEWERGESGFLTHLKTQPLVTLDLCSEANTRERVVTAPRSVATVLTARRLEQDPRRPLQC